MTNQTTKIMTGFSNTLIWIYFISPSNNNWFYSILCKRWIFNWWKSFNEIPTFWNNMDWIFFTFHFLLSHRCPKCTLWIVVISPELIQNIRFKTFFCLFSHIQRKEWPSLLLTFLSYSSDKLNSYNYPTI